MTSSLLEQANCVSALLSFFLFLFWLGGRENFPPKKCIPVPFDRRRETAHPKLSRRAAEEEDEEESIFQ